MHILNKIRLSSEFTYSVDVVLAVVRVVVVDDELDVVHVQATGRDVCRHKNCRASRSNQVEHVRNMKEPCRNINRLWFNCIFVTVSSENLDLMVWFQFFSTGRIIAHHI